MHKGNPNVFAPNALFGSERNASFCWECGRKLQRATCGPNSGKLSFKEVLEDGVWVRVHKQCKPPNSRAATG
jgi:hypothetical protein